MKDSQLSGSSGILGTPAHLSEGAAKAPPQASFRDSTGVLYSPGPQAMAPAICCQLGQSEPLLPSGQSADQGLWGHRAVEAPSAKPTSCPLQGGSSF